MAGSMAKALALALLLLVVLTLCAESAGATKANKLPEIMRRPSKPAQGKQHFRVGEPIFRYRHKPGLLVRESKVRKLQTYLGKPESKVMKLQTYLGQPEYDP